MTWEEQQKILEKFSASPGIINEAVRAALDRLDAALSRIAELEGDNTALCRAVQSQADRIAELEAMKISFLPPAL